VKNSTPPQPLWKNIVPVLRVVDELRESYGRPCRILSSYRSPAYNKAVGGAPLSQHKEFSALDIAFDGVSPQRVYERLLEWRQQGKFSGGLGLYPSSGFVHIDTRGRNSTWKGK
jgi:N-acetylmuramoyl-L-alanine amidase